MTTVAPATAQVLNTFTCFDKLPAGKTYLYCSVSFRKLTYLFTELRIKIWEWVICTPRIVETDGPSASCRSARHKWDSFAMTTKNPAIFSVNYESRVQALKYCELVDLSGAVSRIGIPRTSYINFAIDTIYLATTDIYGAGINIRKPEWQQDLLGIPRRSLQHLTLFYAPNLTSGRRPVPLCAQFYRLKRILPNLKTLTFWMNRTNRHGRYVEYGDRVVNVRLGSPVEIDLRNWYKLKNEDKFVDRVNIKALSQRELGRRHLREVFSVYRLWEYKWPLEKFELVYRNLADDDAEGRDIILEEVDR